MTVAAIGAPLNTLLSPDEFASDPVVRIEVNPNVETTGILLALAFEEYGYPDFSLPVAATAQAQLAAHRDHPAVAASRKMVATLGIDGYASLALRAEPFGSAAAGQLRFALPESMARGAGEGDEAAGRERIIQYLNTVADFYRDAQIDAFLDRYRAGFAQAEREVRRMAPDPSLIAAMEDYFGERLGSYTIVPTLTHPPYGNVGVPIACSDESTDPSCRNAYFVLGTRVSVSDSALVQGVAAGFYDAADPEASRQYVSDLALHEFGHNFVNPYVDTPGMRAAVAEHEALMEPVRDRMAPQAYTAWFAVAIEHLVRTTEVRVALSVGDTARAERLRRHNIDERAFVYLPWLERAAARYEQAGPNGTGDYPTFGPFAPEMVAAFGTVDLVAAKEALGIGSGPLRKVTIRVEGAVPAADTVFVTGGHAALGDWDPTAHPLQLGSDGVWARTFDVEEGTRLEYKATRGSWATEAADASGRPLPNQVVSVKSDTTVTLRVGRWRDEGTPQR